MVILLLLSLLTIPALAQNQPNLHHYLDYTGRDDILSGGVKMIPIETPRGTFKVWTKRVGNNPRIKVLLLHGGPGATHEYFECADSYFPKAGIEYYYYDQLGSAYSDQPDDCQTEIKIPQKVEFNITGNIQLALSSFLKTSYHTTYPLKTTDFFSSHPGSPFYPCNILSPFCCRLAKVLGLR